MQTLMFRGAKDFAWQEVPRPVIDASCQAIVRPLAVSRCDLDYYIATGAYPMPGGFAFGHEIAGEILALGDAVKTVHIGQRVIVSFQISCGVCANCLRGRSNACTAVPRFSAYGLAPSSGTDWGGGFADEVLVPFADTMLTPVPDGISMAAAATLADNASDGYRTIAGTLATDPDAKVLIVGGLAQSVGLFALQAAISLASAPVAYRDWDTQRLAMASTLGAQAHTVNLENDRAAEEFDLVIDASSTDAGLAYALRSTAPCGRCLSVGAAPGGIDGKTLRSAYMKGVHYEISRVHAVSTIDAALSCTCAGKLDPELLLTRRLGFADAAEAMAEPAIKMVFER